MKAKFSEALRKRLESASFNGSVIARDILKASRKHMSQLTTSKANYFDSVRITHGMDGNQTKMRVKITYCDKDLSNPNFPDRGNPQAPYLPENRKRCEPNVFAAFFLDMDSYSSDDKNFFAWSLCCASKITVVADQSVDGIYKAYNAQHYAPYSQDEYNTLGHSCMRYDNESRVAADFYSNFAGCTVLRAVDEEGLTWGRALVWNDVDFVYGGTMNIRGSFLERVYFTYDFVRVMIINKAKEMGVMFRKYVNDYSSYTQFTPLTDFMDEDMFIHEAGKKMVMLASKTVPANTWHKKGAPYLDTMWIVNINADGDLILANHAEADYIASCRNTTGTADRVAYVCPICGRLHYNDDVDHICPVCHGDLYKDTAIGHVYPGKGITKYKGNYVPKEFIKNRRPTKNYQMYLNVNKLYKY